MRQAGRHKDRDLEGYQTVQESERRRRLTSKGRREGREKVSYRKRRERRKDSPDRNQHCTCTCTNPSSNSPNTPPAPPAPPPGRENISKQKLLKENHCRER